MKSSISAVSKAFLITFVVTGVVISSAGSGIIARASEPSETAFDFATMAEDIEIMARILAKSVSARHHDIAGRAKASMLGFLAPQEEVASGDCAGCHTANVYTAGTFGDAVTAYRRAVVGLGSTPDLNMRGFYVPGSGALFTLDVRARTILAAEPEGEKSPAGVWEQTEREVRRGETRMPAVHGKSQQRAVVDPEAVNATVDSLLTAIAGHGAHIEQLVSPDNITVAARFRPKQAALTDPGGGWFTAGKAAPQRVIIQVPVTAIQDHVAGKIDLDAFKERARITRY